MKKNTEYHERTLKTSFTITYVESNKMVSQKQQNGGFQGLGLWGNWGMLVKGYTHAGRR